jgi:tetratricopeptide (TPR) repeat protein
MKRYIHTSVFLALFTLSTACDGFLDAKPSKSIVVPESLQDLEAILDNMGVMNNTPVLALLASDDAYTTLEGYEASEAEMFRMAYTWQENPFVGAESVTDWQWPYQQIFYANIVLDQSNKFIPQNSGEEQRLKRLVGEAHFKRAYAYFYLLQLFTPPYDGNTISTDLGIMLKTDPNINDFPDRSPLKQNYDLVFEDLEIALQSLPPSVSLLTKPSRQAVHAFLSRVYLSIGDFQNAEIHATEALSNGYNLLSFEEIWETLPSPMPEFYFPIPRLSSEVIYFDRVLPASFFFNANYYSDPKVIADLAPHDLRLDLFHYLNPSTNFYNFIGNLTGDFRRFGGIGISEVLFTKAECLARKGMADEALAIINEIAESRANSEAFVPISQIDRDIISVVLAERRKELMGQGYIRWMDLRRLSREEKYNTVVTRVLGETTFRLDLRESNFHFPIPPVETDLNDKAK